MAQNVKLAPKNFQKNVDFAEIQNHRTCDSGAKSTWSVTGTDAFAIGRAIGSRETIQNASHDEKPRTRRMLCAAFASKEDASTLFRKDRGPF